MMIKEQVKALWKVCFDDSEEFVEMYFRLRYKTEVNVAIKSGDEVISALQMLPYPMTFGGETVQTSYISGACTHPDFRSKGVMRELLSQSFARMLRNGVHFSTLIPAEPWLFDYYARMGYASVFKYSTKEIVLPEFIPSKEIAVSVVSEFQEEVYSYLNKKLSERACCIQHTSEDFQVIMTDLAISGGYLFVARQENEIKGITIIYKGDKHIIINDGQVCDWNSCEPNFIRTKHPRSAVATTKDGKILLITVDGRFPEQAGGVNIPELAHLIRVLGGEDALNLDGGGSTTLWLSGASDNGVVNYPCDNGRFDHAGERKVTNILYITQK